MKVKSLCPAYMRFFKLAEPLLLPVCEYPLIPRDERPQVCSVIERCFRTKTEIVFSNRAYSTRSPSGVILMRWRNVPVIDAMGRAVELRCIGEVMQERRTTRWRI